MFKCREDKGEYLLEEQLYFSNNNNIKKDIAFDEEDDDEIFKKIRKESQKTNNEVKAKEPIYEEITFLKSNNYKFDTGFDKFHLMRKKVHYSLILKPIFHIKG